MLQTGPHQPSVMLAAQARTLADLFTQRVASSSARPAWFTKASGQWVPTTWSQFGDASDRLAAGLIDLGLEPGDRVAILGPTRPEWAIQDMAAQLAGCVSLGIYPHQSMEQVHYILAHSGARVIFVADAHELATVLEAAPDLPDLAAIVPWEDALLAGARDPRLRTMSSFTQRALTPAEREARLAARQPKDTAIFVYTSGTTGPPKCAMISHRNILAVMSCQHDLGAFYEDDLSLSFLPMAHVAERVLAFYGRINAGFATAYATSTGAVLEEVREVQPTVFGSVPRIFEKAYSRVLSEVERASPTKRRIFGWATRVGRERMRRIMAGEAVPLGLRLQHALLDRLVFAKLRAAFGGRVRMFITGAAPTPLEVLEFFWAAGLPIYEVYGMTEATVVTHANTDRHVRLGTVGRALPGLEHRIADDGEILLRADWVFQGYYKDAEATATTIIDGWLHTGDIGTVDGDGYLRITDRKKHIIITAGGKNITPANIEKAIKAGDPIISHVHAHGDRRSYVSALVVPSPLETLAFGRDRGLVDKELVATLTAELMADPAARSEALARAMAPITAHPDLKARLRAAVQKGNLQLSQVEKVKRFAVLDRDFSQEEGELTPTMKVRRKAVEQKHAALFDRIYTDPGFGMEA
jgi:long-chain acyl-CoA synthetase